MALYKNLWKWKLFSASFFYDLYATKSDAVSGSHETRNPEEDAYLNSNKTRDEVKDIGILATTFFISIEGHYNIFRVAYCD